MEKLLALVNLGQNLYGKWLFRQLLPGVMIALGLAVITSMMIGGTLIGGFFGEYYVLLRAGDAPQKALLIVGGMAVAATMLSAALTVLWFRRLSGMPKRALRDKSYVIAHANEVIDAFVEGFNHPPQI